MKTFLSIYYFAVVANVFLFLSSCGSMMDSDVGGKLVRAIIACFICAGLAIIGTVTALFATVRRSDSAGKLWVATGFAIAPGLLLLLRQ